MEPHAYKMVPDGVTVHTGRLKFGQAVTPETLRELTKDIERETEMLASIPVDIVLLGCTSGTLIEGPGYDQKIISLIEKASKGIPGLTTSTAVLQALRRLGLKKIAVATPYIKAINEAEIRFLEGNGFKVTCLKGLELLNNSEFLSQPPYVLYNLAYNAYKERPEADGVFISCTSVRSPDVIEDLEKNIGKPVVTSTQASIWAALRKIGINEQIKGFGQLMEKY
jgi:maleate isomerase